MPKKLADQPAPAERAEQIPLRRKVQASRTHRLTKAVAWAAIIHAAAAVAYCAAHWYDALTH